MQIFDKFVPFSSAARLLLCEPLLVAPPEEGAREQGSDYKTAVCNGYQLKKRKMELTQREVDVQTVQVPRRPFGLEDLWGNGVTAGPPDDCTR